MVEKYSAELSYSGGIDGKLVTDLAVPVMMKITVNTGVAALLLMIIDSAV